MIFGAVSIASKNKKSPWNLSSNESELGFQGLSSGGREILLAIHNRALLPPNDGVQAGAGGAAGGMMNLEIGGDHGAGHKEMFPTGSVSGHLTILPLLEFIFSHPTPVAREPCQIKELTIIAGLQDLSRAYLAGLVFWLKYD